MQKMTHKSHHRHPLLVITLTTLLLHFSQLPGSHAQNNEMDVASKVVTHEEMSVSAMTDQNLKSIYTNDNVTVQCMIKRDCPLSSLDACKSLATLQWFLPNSLSPNQTESRIEMRYMINTKNRTASSVRVIIIAEMAVNQIGFQHEGFYQCSGVKRRGGFRLNISENTDKKCSFADQCKSLNCFASKCQCKTVDENYIPETSKCVTKKLLGESCEFSSECSPKKILTLKDILSKESSNIECLNKMCSCVKNTTSVLVAFPSQTRLCLPDNLPLNSECLHKNQCSISGSFCGLDSETMTSVCKCRDGWRQLGAKCLKHRTCNSTFLGFNENYIGGAGCEANQFCRNSICLCSPKYEFSEEGVCISTMPIKEEEFLKQYGSLILMVVLAIVVLISIIGISHMISTRVANWSRNRRQEAYRKQMARQHGQHRYVGSPHEYPKEILAGPRKNQRNGR